MNTADGLLAVVIAQLAWIMYKVGALESRVKELQRQVQTLYALLNKG